jgi:ribosomal protein S12 methylthiotransferase
MYCYPTSLRQSFLDAMARQPKVCRYIDMPLQHASAPVLARMQRGGGADQYRRMIDNIRNTVPGVALRTTFITGYPGEAEADFRTLMDFVREVEFDRLGVFTYSDEEGTAGVGHDPKVPKRVMAQRRRELMTLQAGISKKRNRAMIGAQTSALVDSLDSRGAVARLASQAPDIDGIVRVRSDQVVPGDLVPITITGAGQYDLTAKPANL